MLAKGIAGAALTLASSIAFGGQFEYQIKSFAPNITDTDCYDRIAQIAEVFAEKSGAIINEASCIVDEFDDTVLSGIITYSSEERVKLTRLVDYGNSGVEVTAMYPSQEACKEDLARQTELFVQQTGLTPHVGYCHSRHTSSTQKWTLQLEAVGEASTQHYYMGVYLSGVPAQGYDAYWAEIKQHLEAKGLVITNAQFGYSIFYYRLTVGYYAAARQHIYHNGDVRVESPAACAAILDRAQAAFSVLSNSPISIFCDQSDSQWGSRLNIYTLEPSLSEPTEYKYRQLPGYYDSIAACEAARSSQVDQLQSRGVRVLEAFCGTDSNRRVVLHGFLRR
jgi:hypothetical protein